MCPQHTQITSVTYVNTYKFIALITAIALLVGDFNNTSLRITGVLHSIIRYINPSNHMVEIRA